MGLFDKFNKRSGYYNGTELKEQGKYDEAFECFNKVLKISDFGASKSKISKALELDFEPARKINKSFCLLN